MQLSAVGMHTCFPGALIAAEPAPVSLRNGRFDAINEDDRITSALAGADAYLAIDRRRHRHEDGA